MAEIKVNINEFLSVSKKFDLAAESCTKIQERLKSASEDLLNNWQGKSMKAFDKEYTTLYKNMFNYKDVLQSISKDLYEIATRFEEVDNSIKNDILNSGNSK